MTADQNLSDLSDKQLEDLHADAVRMAQSGTREQRRQAEDLLPLLGAVLEQRRATRATTRDDDDRVNARRDAIVGRGHKDGSHD